VSSAEFSDGACPVYSARLTSPDTNYVYDGQVTRTYVILDGLGEPELGRQLSVRLAAAGFDNAVDVAGQCGWVSPRADGSATELTERDVDRAASIVRAFGVEMRDRAGETFRAVNDLEALRDRLAREYKARLAQAIMFGLPAIVLHYVGPLLSPGGGQSAAGLRFPWLFEMLLVGWMCYVAAWPIIWQGVASLIHLRATSDLLTTCIIFASFAPSAIGALSMLFTNEPWFGSPHAGEGPVFHATVLTVMLAVAQRWLLHRHANRLSGRADWMPRGWGRFVAAWLAFACAVTVAQAMRDDVSLATAWHDGVMVAMLLPPMLCLGAVNRVTPGWSAALPVVAFALFLQVAPGAWGMQLGSMGIEIAFGFGVLMTAVFVVGWRRVDDRTGGGTSVGGGA